MTERDKQTVAEIELLKLKGIIKNITSLKEQNQALEFSLMGTGIDYSKDHVQSSPVNSMELVLSQVCDNSKKIEGLKDEARSYIKKINKINNTCCIKILYDIFINNKSFGLITKENNYKNRSYTQYLYKKALTLYFNHNI